MKKGFLILLLLSFNAHAECFPELPTLNNGNWCTLCWQAPTEREDGTALSIDELSDYIIEVKNPFEWVNYDANLINTTTGVYWYSNDGCPNCDTVRIRAVDLDGRRSVWAYPVCNPVQPLICQ